MKILPYLMILICLGNGWCAMAQAPFTPGNIVVYRVGDGSGPLTTSATLVFLDEYTADGALVQSIQLPAAGSKKITIGNMLNSGFITLSANGKYLAVPGYNATPGTDLSGAGADRSIGLIDVNGTVSSITTIPQSASGNVFINAAASDGGANLWFSGSPGLAYTTVGATTATIIANLGGLLSTSVLISNGQLYAGTDRTGRVGNGLPVTAGQSFTTLPGNGDANHNQFAFADLDPTVPGVDVYYAASGAVTDGGLKKYSLINGNWVSTGTVGTRLERYSGLTIKVSGNSVTVFATRLGNNSVTVRGGQLVKLVDNSGYGGTLTGTPIVMASVTIPDTKAYRGVARVPVACEPVGVLSAPDISASQATLLWTPPVSGGTGYEYAVTTAATEPSTATGITNTSVTVTGLLNATNYYAWVRNICNATTRSEWMSTAFTTGCKAPPVAGINIDISKAGGIAVKWRKVFGAAGYEYVVGTSTNPPAAGTPINDTAFTIARLSAVTKYFLHVRTTCGGGTFSPWVTRPFETGCFVPAPQATLLAKSAGVQWNRVPNAVKYEFAVSFSPARPVGGTYTLDTAYLVRKVDEGKPYYFHIRAVCTTGALSDWYTLSFNGKGLHLYPNPVQDLLHLKLPGAAVAPATIIIGDAMGRVMAKLRMNNNETTVNTKGWAAGLYFVRYDDGVKPYVVSIIKQ